MISGQSPLPIHPKKPLDSSMKSSSVNRVPVQGSRIQNVSQQLSAAIHTSNELFKKRKKELKYLEELNQIWKFLDTEPKGPVMDVYEYLLDMKANSSTHVGEEAESVLTYLDSIRMRGY